MRFLRSLFKSPRGWYNYSALLILTVVLLLFYLIQMTYLNSFINMRYGRKKESDNKLQGAEFSFFPNFKFQGEQLVHFDLKGAPPKISYLVDFIPFIKKLGATGLLIEYEDMFPYHGELEGISATNAYTLKDIATIVKTAQNNNMTIIPLIPTFSHFEFVLKLERFKDFREVEDHPAELCPSQNKIYTVIYKMIDQVVAAHPKANYLHIGTDEVFLIGMCPKCQNVMKRNKWRKEDIYFNHVKKLAQYIIKTYPEVRPIIWGDRLLKQNEKTILMYSIPDFVDVMLWNYHSEMNTFPQKDDMNSFARLFKHIWIASAFKGATGRKKIVTDPDYHFRNVRAWMYFVEEWKSKIEFKGIALTGWQRYSHFAVLCELLPVGVPSLALSLQYLNKKRGSDYEAVKQALGCNDLVPLNLLEIRDLKLMSRLRCDFPGYRIYHIIHSFYNEVREIKALLNLVDIGDMSFYSIVHSTSNPAYIYKFSLKSYKNQLIKFNEMENNIRTALSEVYDQHTTNEWILTYVTPLRLHLEAAVNLISALRNLKVWPRRPFPDITPKVQQFFNKTCGQTETLGCKLFNFH